MQRTRSTPSADRRVFLRRASTFSPVLLLLLSACSPDDAPSILKPGGPAAERVESLWWPMFWISTAVFVVVAAMLVQAALKGRRDDGSDIDKREVSWGEPFIAIAGVLIPVLILGGVYVFSLRRDGRSRRSGADDPDNHDRGRRSRLVVGGPLSDNGAVTANEIHIPVGEPVEVELTTADVIHSFWVPRLQVKTDQIPGRQPHRGSRPTSRARYRGQCAEFCGLQHANMVFYVVAEPRARVRRVARERGRAPAADPTAGGRVDLPGGFLCRVPRRAAGPMRPTELGSRPHPLDCARDLGRRPSRTTPRTCCGFVRDPHDFKPGVTMPPTELTDDELDRGRRLPGGPRLMATIAETTRCDLGREARARSSFISTVDHKRIGMRYFYTGMLFFMLGGIEALLIRLQLAGPSLDLLDPEAYNQLFSMHGITMMFLFAMPVLSGFGNYFVPLMIGARDMAFPRLNAFGYWVFLAGGVFMYSAFLVGSRPQRRVVQLPAARRCRTSRPGLNIDFYALGLIFLGISTTGGAINFIVTILKLRAPGMTLNRIPIFVWGELAMAFQIVFALPMLTLACVLLALQRSVRVPLLRRRGRRRPDPVAAPLLDLRTSRGLHRRSAGLRDRVGDHPDARSTADDRLHVHRSGRARHRPDRFRSVGPPHVRNGTASDDDGVHLGGVLHGRDPESGVQVFAWLATLVSGKIRPQNADALHPRVHRDLRDRRRDRSHVLGDPLRPSHATTPTSSWPTSITSWSAARCSRCSLRSSTGVRR